ncbi:hypothetical protein B0H19DRAFT_1122685 [Mycena capillaripes]|nr:hypothetical protein B0H19DRAFT_1122685 [Mycena capillaripes]
MALEVGTIVMGVTHVTFAVVVVGRGGGGPVPVAARKLGGRRDTVITLNQSLCGLGTRRHHARSKRVIATWLWSLVVIKPHSLELALLRSLSCLGDLGSLACFSGLHFLGQLYLLSAHAPDPGANRAFSVTVTVVVAMEFSRAGLVAVVVIFIIIVAGSGGICMVTLRVGLGRGPRARVFVARAAESVTCIVVDLVILFVLCTASGLATGRGRGGSMRTAGLLRHCEWSSAIRRR